MFFRATAAPARQISSLAAVGDAPTPGRREGDGASDCPSKPHNAHMPHRLKSLLRVAIILVFPPVLGAQSSTNTDPARPEFLAAMQRVASHLPDLPDSPGLKSYAIYDYLIAARLRRDLSGADESLDATIDEFLGARTGQPVTRALKREWLASLAQRGRWDWFLPRSADTSDPVLMCRRLQGRLETQETRGLKAAALLRWMVPQKPPAECGPAFAWLREQGLLTPALSVGRTRATLVADNPRLAREFAADVPLKYRTALLQWADLLDSPRSINVLAMHPDWTVDPDALAAGFEKLSHNEPAHALDLLPRLLARHGMTPELEERLKRTAALGAAYDRDPRAIAAFDDLAAAGGDVPVQEWRVRAALWAGDYARARAWIEQMPATLAAQPRWRYWHARTLSATENAETAAPIFGEVAGLRDYYGYLAADRLNQPYQLNARPSPIDAAAQTALAAEPGLVRAHALFDCDMIEEANSEWTAVFGGSDAPLKVQAALLASRWGWYAQAITTLAQSGDFDDVALRYPRPYLEAVSEASKLAQLPQDWILAVMRQESLFRKDAVSHADARGVMQMRPGTAAAVARRWHIPPPKRDGLFDPVVAVPLGAAYLRELLDHYGEQLALSFAAYNAGPASVAHWLPRKPMEVDVWIENIPYNETRSYVQHILEHIVAYASVRNAEPTRLNVLLSEVEPATPAL
jgi:soluble lytic murein transglycosylase